MNIDDYKGFNFKIEESEDIRVYFNVDLSNELIDITFSSDDYETISDPDDIECYMKKIFFGDITLSDKQPN